MVTHEVLIDAVDEKGYQYVKVGEKIHLFFEDEKCDKLKSITLIDCEGYASSFTYPKAIKCHENENKKVWDVRHSKDIINKIVSKIDEKKNKTRYEFKWDEVKKIEDEFKCLLFIKLRKYIWTLGSKSGSGGGFQK